MSLLLSFAALQPSSNPATWVRPTADPGAYLAAPLLLLLYYLILFLLVHRRRKPLPIIPQYAPPRNLSPAALRYLFIGDSDSKSVAAVLLQLASRGHRRHSRCALYAGLSRFHSPALPRPW